MKSLATDKEILHMYKSGMTYGMISAVAHVSRQRVHQIVKYKKHNKVFSILGYKITIEKI
jgi:hypothetical protein